MKAEYIIKIDGEPDIMGNYPLKDKPQELVRCKDCKWFEKVENALVANQRCRILHRAVANDWFCADGEKKTDI